MKKIIIVVLAICLFLCACKNVPKNVDEQVEISYDEIKTLVNLDFTFTNYTHYASDMISLNQEE